MHLKLGSYKKVPPYIKPVTVIAAQSFPSSRQENSPNMGLVQKPFTSTQQ